LTAGSRAAFLTGGASGIGLATAIRLAKEGYGLHLLDRDDAALRTAARTLGDRVLTSHVADVRDQDAVRSAAEGAVQRHGAPWLVVNNAATGRSATLLETTPTVWDLVVGVGLTGAFHVCSSLLPAMIASGGGVVVNISSAAAIVGLPARFAYSAAKAGLLGFTRSVAVDYGPSGIRCNAICPGTVDTPWNRRIVEASDDPASVEAAMNARSLDGRMGRPEDVAGGVAFLAGDDGRFMNGAVLVMDGGMTIV
jgi:NAD(P)-dependent dehydrogenase (short-subunit alcohol dehydrogenase family)